MKLVNNLSLTYTADPKKLLNNTKQWPIYLQITQMEKRIQWSYALLQTTLHKAKTVFSFISKNRRYRGRESSNYGALKTTAVADFKAECNDMEV